METDMLEYEEALRLVRSNGARRKFPNSEDARARGAHLFPTFNPKFSVQFHKSTVFTMGSCFARNIEEVLLPLNVNLPTLNFSVPHLEWPHRPNAILNEYNPGTMSQRILSAMQASTLPVETIIPVDDLFIDLLLPGGAPVTYNRAIERRQEISTVYENLGKSQILIITLMWKPGFILTTCPRIRLQKHIKVDSSSGILMCRSVFA
jgi:GSCFA family